MALFFDQKWFNARLEAAGLAKADLAHALGLTAEELAEMWKDQREISDREIGTMALLLGVSEDDVRKYGGIQGSPEARAAAKVRGVAAASLPTTLTVEERLDRLEAKFDEILEEIRRKN